MANATYFPAEIVEMGTLKELDGNNNAVLNINSKYEKTVQITEDVKFEEDFEPRITLFAKKAREAVELITEGAMVIFTSVRRNPRSWVSENSGKRIEQVELIAEGFKVLPKAKFNKTVKAMEEAGLIFDTDLLTYTEADRLAETAQTAAIVDDDDGDEADV